MRLQSLAILALSAFATASPAASRVSPLMRDFIGLNGHTVRFRPELYQPVCRLVRDYHPVSWDLDTNTSQPPPFPFAKNRVDWSHVYGSWSDKGWSIDASLMFESLDQRQWHNVTNDARAYGRAFAAEFGPSGKRKLVDSVEIGNEPGRWSDTDYTQMFRAMAMGIREGDPALKIATCNLTVGKSGSHEKSVACVAASPGLFDVLNVHSYAQLENWPTWRRSFPEDSRLAKYLQDVQALCRWRDEHVPAKPVWITEFGYDSSTKPAPKTGDFAKWVGVTDEQQAQWLIRSLLVFSAMPVERAYVYFFNDDDKPQLHASSGITRHFQPKPSFHALAHLQRVLGDYRFSRMVTNAADRLRIQEYSHASDPGKTVWAAWTPTAGGAASTEKVTGTPGKLIAAQRMPLIADAGDAPDAAHQESDGSMTLRVNGSPLYLMFQRQ